MDPMHRTLHRNLLKYSVQRQMFNSDGSIADVRKSVLVEVVIEGKRTVELMSGSKFDTLPSLSETIELLPEGSVIEVWDGRFLFGSGKSQSGYLKLETSPTAPVQTESLF